MKGQPERGNSGIRGVRNRIGHHHDMRSVIRIVHDRSHTLETVPGHLRQPQRRFRSFEFGRRRLRPGNGLAVGQNDHRVPEDGRAADEHAQRGAGGLGPQFTNVGMLRAGRGHRVRGFEMALQIGHHGRRHGPRFVTQAQFLFAIGDARRHEQRRQANERQRRADDEHLKAKRSRRHGFARNPAAGSVRPAASNPAARSRHESQCPHGTPSGDGS